MRHPNDFLETRPSLLAALKDGAVDQDWREFFALYAPPIHRIARHRNLTAADAEDIVQQVMLAVLGHIKDFRYERDRSRFRQWIIRIAENKICDFVRKRKPMARSTEVLDQQSTSHGGANGEGGAEAMWEREWRRQDLMYCLDQVAADISPRRMMAFDMYVMHGVSAERTARELGMTTAYVYVTRNQVLQMLHEHLRRLEADGGDGTPTQEDRP